MNVNSSISLHVVWLKEQETWEIGCVFIIDMVFPFAYWIRTQAEHEVGELKASTEGKLRSITRLSTQKKREREEERERKWPKHYLLRGVN